ncbi:MAG: hypothetical protein RXR16_03575 [Thermocladium sp.]
MIEAVLVERGATCLVLGRELHVELNALGAPHKFLSRGNFVIVSNDGFHYHADELHCELRVFNKDFTVKVLKTLRNRLESDTPILINPFLLEYIDRLLKRL